MHQACAGFTCARHALSKSFYRDCWSFCAWWDEWGGGGESLLILVPVLPLLCRSNLSLARCAIPQRRDFFFKERHRQCSTNQQSFLQKLRHCSWLQSPGPWLAAQFWNPTTISELSKKAFHLDWMAQLGSPYLNSFPQPVCLHPFCCLPGGFSTPRPHPPSFSEWKFQHSPVSFACCWITKPGSDWWKVRNFYYVFCTCAVCATLQRLF